MAVGLHCSAWDRARASQMHPSGQAARAARLFMATQAESGHICPLTMTNASVAANASAAKMLIREKLCVWLVSESALGPEEVNRMFVSLHPTGRLKGSPTLRL